MCLEHRRGNSSDPALITLVLRPARADHSDGDPFAGKPLLAHVHRAERGKSAVPQHQRSRAVDGRARRQRNRLERQHRKHLGRQ